MTAARKSIPKRAQPAARTKDAHLSEEKFVKAFHASIDAILSATPEHFHLHDRAGRYLFASPTTLKAIGLTAEQVVGKTWRELGFSEEAGLDFERRLKTVFETGAAVTAELDLKVMGGVRRFEQILSPVRSEAGQVVMAVSTVHDVTERRQAEEALKQYAADLAVRNEDLDTFAHTVAHDLKNPLGNIIGFTEWLQARPQMSEDDRQDYLNIIARNAAKMAAIIDELLLLARVRKGDVELAPLDMERIVGEVLQRLSFVSAKACAVICAPDRWPIALGHAPWVEEVWVNYLSNAIKYGGTPPHIELGCDLDTNEMIRFWVHDDGPGIPPEVQAQLFAPFTQLSKVRATGSGLGLSIVRQIVEKMGGTVGVKSEPGRGSTFSFTLPMTV